MLAYVDPGKISNFLDLSESNNLARKPKKMTSRTYKNRRYTGIVMHDSYLKIGKAVEDCIHIVAMREHFCEGMPWEETKYFDLHNSLYSRRYKLKKSLTKKIGTDFKSFEKDKLSKYDQIHDDIKSNGFKKSNSIEENIEVALDSNGRVLLIDGRHRLFLAKALSLSSIPVSVNLISETFAKLFLDNIKTLSINDSILKASLADLCSENVNFIKQQLQLSKIKDRLKLLDVTEGGVRNKGVLIPPRSTIAVEQLDNS